MKILQLSVLVAAIVVAVALINVETQEVGLDSLSMSQIQALASLGQNETLNATQILSLPLLLALGYINVLLNQTQINITAIESDPAFESIIQQIGSSYLN